MTTTPNNNPMEQTALLDEYLTPQEVSALLKFKTPRPIYDAIKSGELVAIELGRNYRVARADFQAWLNRNRLEQDGRLEQPAMTKPAARRGGRSAASVLEEAA